MAIRRFHIFASGSLIGGLWQKYQGVLDFADSDLPIHLENLPQKRLEVIKECFKKSLVSGLILSY